MLLPSTRRSQSSTIRHILWTDLSVNTTFIGRESWTARKRKPLLLLRLRQRHKYSQKKPEFLLKKTAFVKRSCWIIIEEAGYQTITLKLWRCLYTSLPRNYYNVFLEYFCGWYYALLWVRLYTVNDESFKIMTGAMIRFGLFNNT